MNDSTPTRPRDESTSIGTNAKKNLYHHLICDRLWGRGATIELDEWNSYAGVGVRGLGSQIINLHERSLEKDRSLDSLGSAYFLNDFVEKGQVIDTYMEAVGGDLTNLWHAARAAAKQPFVSHRRLRKDLDLPGKNTTPLHAMSSNTYHPYGHKHIGVMKHNR